MDNETLTGMIMAYEQGDLDFDETIELFIELIKRNWIKNFQGHYQRTAFRLVSEGYIKASDLV